MLRVGQSNHYPQCDHNCEQSLLKKKTWEVYVFLDATRTRGILPVGIDSVFFFLIASLRFASLALPNVRNSRRIASLSLRFAHYQNL